MTSPDMKKFAIILPLVLGGCGVALPAAIVAVETTYIGIKTYTEIAQPIIVEACKIYNGIRVDINAKLIGKSISQSDWNKIIWLIDAGDAFCKNPPSNGDPITMAIWLAQVGGMLIAEVEQAINRSTNF
jgi:hypothetical protein